MSSVSNRERLSTRVNAHAGLLAPTGVRPRTRTSLTLAPTVSLGASSAASRLPQWLKRPTGAAQADRIVPDYLTPPTPDLAGVTPELLEPHGPLTIRGVTYWPVKLEDLRPGDIAFDYRAVGRSWRQNVISLGERVQNVTRPDRAGSANVLHAFIVLQTYPKLGKLRVADAATGAPPYGVVLEDVDLGALQTQDAFHLFYRLKDPRMQLRIATIARNWAAQFVANFSSRNALNSLVQQRDLDDITQLRLLHLSRSSGLEEPMRNADNTPYEVMCSEFVSNVGAAAAMSLYADDHMGVRLGDPETLRALAQGPGGAVFNANPASMTPSALAQRLATDPQAEVVGYTYGQG